jgi:hypothetical protein
MIRDAHGFIVQQPEMDGDDSPVRNGLMAISGSVLDQELVCQFVLADGSIIRHPHQTIRGNNDPKESSRDQLIVLVAALYAADEVFLLDKIRSRYWLNINKDILSPSHKLFIATAARHWSRYLWAIPGYPMLVLDILWHSIINPGHELNQILSMCSVMGKGWISLVCRLHHDWQRNIEDYFGVHPTSHGKWRGQPEIAFALIKYISSRMR